MLTYINTAILFTTHQLMSCKSIELNYINCFQSVNFRYNRMLICYKLVCLFSYIQHYLYLKICTHQYCVSNFVFLLIISYL
jgi:hypothetical protein